MNREEKSEASYHHPYYDYYSYSAGKSQIATLIL
jgi:hypothetical protein